jgi:S-adenosylmethionine:tRNA ribosyltransferase-isomerase
VDFVEKGKPQKVRVSKKIDYQYFLEFGEMPLPPYIQEARDERSARQRDLEMYQTDWAEEVGSLAAPTASLHFKNNDLEKIKNRGADVESVCLHVGLGTFLPITSDFLEEHKMHSEFVSVEKHVWEKIKDCKREGGRVWALGSTVTRALESVELGLLKEEGDTFRGETDLFIKPGYEFRVVDILLTNFHQPESTLIAMVMAFAGKEEVRRCYQWAIERKFQLFSYGDLTVWMK